MSNWYSKHQKEVKNGNPYSLKNRQKRISKHNDVYLVNESSVHPKLCLSQSKNVTATTRIAQCVPSNFAMGKNLGSAIACYYSEPQDFGKLLLNNVLPGWLVGYFDQPKNRYIYNLVTKRQFFSCNCP